MKITLCGKSVLEMGWDDPYRHYEEEGYPIGFTDAIKSAKYTRHGRGYSLGISCSKEIALYIAEALSDCAEAWRGQCDEDALPGIRAMERDSDKIRKAVNPNLGRP